MSQSQSMVLQSERVFTMANSTPRRRVSIQYTPRPCSVQRIRVVKGWTEGNREVERGVLSVGEV